MGIGQKAGKRGGVILGLRSHLLGLVVVAFLPALAVGGLASWQAVTGHLEAFQVQLRDTARALATAADREFEARIAALTTLAESPLLDAPLADLSAFHPHAQRAAAALGTPIVIIGPDNRQLLNTSLPPGTPLPLTQTAVPYSGALQSGRPAVTNLLQAASDQAAIVAVLVPIRRDGRTLATLSTRITPDRLQRLLEAQKFENGRFAALVDGNGRIVGRSLADLVPGTRAASWYMAGVASNTGWMSGPGVDGRGVVTAFSALTAGSGWTVAVAAPSELYLASWGVPLAAILLGGAVALGLASLLALALAHRILRPLQVLTDAANAVAEGRQQALAQAADAAQPPARVTEFKALRDALTRAAQTLAGRNRDLAASEARLRAIVETAVDAIVVIDEKGTVHSFNGAAETIFRYPAEEVIGRNVSVIMGAGDAARHDGHLARFMATGERRIIGIGREVEGHRRDGSAVPLDLSIAEWRDGEGQRFLTGIMRDISSKKAEEERRLLLAREVDHRAKNLLAVVQSVIRLTPRESAEAFAQSVEARVMALARVQSLLAEENWAGAELRAVAERELAPYRLGNNGSAVQIRAEGPVVMLPAEAVQPVAMILHELIANAAKHGALREVGGQVELRWRVEPAPAARGDDMLCLEWTERGEHFRDVAPRRRGFGTRLINATVQHQLGGTLTQRWETGAMRCELRLRLRPARKKEEVLFGAA
ncbi:sensor histidine kinase [Teichococcus oryzae]|uniref:Sensor protein FixL n=1 Tax=Teichococcus oryzae TaxID=1608942 RepID=A0A5B2TB59_9PROT|nr:PAS domain S-box protein [Pseudoroseomonas oryzae]KAA2211429.1 PAS domain S-box protein [Pseudoroseomonas oryzae]